MIGMIIRPQLLGFLAFILFLLPSSGQTAEGRPPAIGKLSAEAQVAALRQAPATVGLSIESCTALFPNKLANGVWNGWEVTVANASEKPQTAQVLVRFDKFHISFMRQVLVPARMRYAVQIPVLPDYAPKDFAKFFKQAPSRTETRPDGTKQEVVRENGSLGCIAGLVDPVTGQEKQPFTMLSILSSARTQNLVIVDDFITPPAEDFSGLRNGLPFVLGDWPVSTGAQDATLFLNEQVLAGEDKHPVQFSFIDSGRMPGSEEGYESVFTLLLGGHRPLNPAQKIMLERWISSGGRLAVFPVGNIRLFLNDPFWQGLLPVALTGERRALAEDAAAYQKVCGKTFDPTKHLPMAAAQLKPGAELLCGGKSATLSARRVYGAGEVLFYAFRGSDLKNAGDLTGAVKFFSHLTGERAAALPGLQDRFRLNARNLLQALTGLPVPQKWVIAALMFVFLGVATGILVTLRLKKRGELGWVLLMGWSLIVFLFALVLLGGGNASLSSGEIGVTQLTGAAGAGINRSYAGAFPSGDVRGSFSWRQAGAAFSPQSMAGGEALRESLAVMENYYPQMPQIQMLPGQFWGGQSLGQAVFGQGLRGQVRFTATGVRGEVVNQSGRKLTDCLLRINRRILYLGDLASGERSDLARAESLRLEEFAKKDFGAGWAEKRNIISQLLYDAELNRVAAPVLLAFTNDSLCSFSINGAASKNNARQLIAVVPEVLAEKGALVPAGMCGMSLVRTGGVAGYYGFPVRPAEALNQEIKPTALNASRSRAGGGLPSAGAHEGQRDKAPLFDPQYDCAFPGWRGGTMPVRFTVRFVPPAGLTAFRPGAAVLTVRGGWTGMTAEVLIGRSGEEQPKRLATLQPGPVQQEIKIPDYAAYAGEDGAEISVRMRPVPNAGATSRWNLDELELQMTGTVEE